MRFISVSLCSCTLFIAALSALELHAESTDYLRACWERQVMPLGDNAVEFRYDETRNLQFHSPEPWMTEPRETSGKVCCGDDLFIKSDTLIWREKEYVTTTQFLNNELLIRGYRSEELETVTEDMVADLPFKTARYSPVLLLNYALQQDPVVESSSTSDHAIYRMTINRAEVELFIRRSDFLLEKVTVTEHHDLWGDVTQTLSYEDFARHDDLWYAQRVGIRRVNDISEEVLLTEPGIVSATTPLLERPDDYTIERSEEVPYTASTEKISDHVYSISLPQAESRSALVEFSDFFVAVEAPLNSRNGDLVIEEARNIDPGKPIRYYVFTHHHPWSIGGVRSFVHYGATVMIRPEILDYLTFIVEAPHRLQPDKLHEDPKPLKFELLDSLSVITDGKLELRAYHLGRLSDHTDDYTVFYLPQDKLILEGDLTWIPADKPVEKASGREQGLYDAIISRGLDVEFIHQHWPLPELYGMHNLLPFEKLEEAAGAE